MLVLVQLSNFLQQMQLFYADTSTIAKRFWILPESKAQRSETIQTCMTAAHKAPTVAKADRVAL